MKIKFKPPVVTVFESGLTVITEKRPHLESVSFGAYVRVGSRDESPSENGIAHFLEHMAFKGTEKRSALDIVIQAENVGAQLNAYTSHDHTAYFIKTLQENTAIGVDIIGDILCHSKFDPEDVLHERDVIIQEIADSKDDISGSLAERFQLISYPNQAIGRPIAGTEESVRSIDSNRLKAFVEKYYVPSNTVVTACGDLEHNEICDLVHEHFKDLKGLKPAVSGKAIYAGGEYREERDAGQNHLFLGFQSPSRMDHDLFDSIILSIILGGGMSSRLFQKIREELGLCYDLHATVSIESDTGIFMIYTASSEPDNVLLPEIWNEIKGLNDVVGEDELKRAKALFKADVLMSRESPGYRCGQMAEQWQNHKRIIAREEIIARIDSISASDILLVSQKIFSGKPTLSVLNSIR
jgi:predicted Zn-dependent peptidase